MAYLDDEGGEAYLESKFNIVSPRNIKMWVKSYLAFVEEDLKRSRKKLSVVELYLSSEISYQYLAIQEGMTNPSMIVNWVNRFRAAGPDVLRPRKKRLLKCNLLSSTM